MADEISFVKMHGAGNDYIYVNCLERDITEPEELAKEISDRHFGVGGDGLVLIEPSSKADFRMRMFNADGSEAQMCGNAVRCIAKYVSDSGLTDKEEVSLETQAGQILLQLQFSQNGEGARVVETVRVNMGPPILDPKMIPTLLEGESIIDQPFPLEIPPGLTVPELRVSCVSMGNPHAIFFVPELSDDLVLRVGPIIEVDPRFPERTNVEFAVVKNRKKIDLRVWERGSGETLACGTGAAATAVAGVLNDLTEPEVSVSLPGGVLSLEWDQASETVYKTGPATRVFEGIYRRI